MDYTILNCGDLEITITEEERLKLIEDKVSSFYEILTPLVNDSQFEWLYSDEVDTNTMNPIIGMIDDRGNIIKSWTTPSQVNQSINRLLIKGYCFLYAM